jgi:hypothetical protein
VLVEHRFRVPPPATSVEALEMSQCIERCEPLYTMDPNRYGACLAACPGIEITENAPCEPEALRDGGWCYELVREQEVVDERASRLAGEVLVGLIEVALKAAFDDDGGDKSERKHRHHSKHRKHRKHQKPRKQSSVEVPVL